MSPNSFACVLFFFFFFFSHQVSASDAVFEDGYTVKTVIDGRKFAINPHAVMLKPGSSDLVVLDSSRSAFYTVPFPSSEDSVIKLLSGGEIGYKDGEPRSVRFNKPRSFAVDLKGNVYVADRNNNVIRKITNSGVTSTIAGVKNMTGRDDGPAQNATFSNDFELVFVPELCALLVSDHGSQLVRQIDLKAQDCRRDSDPGHGMLATSIWGAVVGVALLIGFVVGFAARPYVFSHEGMRINGFSETWKLCRTNLGKAVRILCFVIRSGVADFSLVCTFLERLFLMSFSHLSIMCRFDYLGPRVSTEKQSLSLLDSDKVGSISSSSNNSSSSNETAMVSEKYVNQLKDLMTFDGRSDLTNPSVTDEKFDVDSCFGNGRLDNMIKANVMHFAGVSKETSNLVKRR